MLAIVLARRPWREYDENITLFTAGLGKVEVLARGSKKIVSKNSAALEPYFLIEAEIIPGKDIIHLGSVEPINSFKNIRGSLEKSLAASYAVTSLCKLMQSPEPDKEVFYLLASWLEFLNQKSIAYRTIYLDAFMAKLFAYLGWDISHEEKVGGLINSNIKYLISNSWKKLLEWSMSQSERDVLHKNVFELLSYYGEVKIVDWSSARFLQWALWFIVDNLID